MKSVIERWTDLVIPEFWECVNDDTEDDVETNRCDDNEEGQVKDGLV